MTQVLFIGSSIFEQWTEVSGLLPGVNIINAAAGGTETIDWLNCIDETLQKYQPEVLCLYCGSNDFGRGKPYETIKENLQDIFRKISAFNPRIKIVYYSVILAPEKEARWQEIKQFHQETAEFLSKSGGYFIDLNPVFFDGAGNVRAELFVEDRLHLTAQAYKEMTEMIRPLVREICF